MKYVGLAMCFVLLLSGCSFGESEMDKALDLRAQVLAASEVSFHAHIVADYGDQLHTFSMNCSGNGQGDMQFAVTEPETISGITGTISEEGGKLTFDDKALFFELLTDDQLSPVSAPWIFLRTIRSGYIRSAGMEGEYLRLTIDDSYEEDALQLDIWTDENNLPVRTDILYDGKRILSLDIEEFDIR